MIDTMHNQFGAPLSGRHDESHALGAAVASVRSGRPALVMIDGAAGIGKTALVRQLLAGDDARVLWASGDPSERAVPFAVADQLLRRAAVEAPVLESPAAHYTGVGLAILEALGAEPGLTIAVIDDAHWADPASLRALLFAVRRLVAEPVLVVLTARTEDLHVVPDGFARSADARLTLGPLGVDDVRTLVRRRELSLSGHMIARVHELAAGVPLHVCALLDEFGAGGNP